MGRPNERPILFSGPMVRAILDGRKTQTRRVVKPLIDSDRLNAEQWPAHSPFVGVDGIWRWKNGKVSWSDNDRRCPFGDPGDRLWVRETWRRHPDQPGGTVWYRADPMVEDCVARSTPGWKWTTSIFMPRWASRITLEITEVRVQRLQEISEEDALAEGVRSQIKHSAAFSDLWDSINATRGHGWETNPWVWALTFKRVDV